jgi:hypothetical protein
MTDRSRIQRLARAHAEEFRRAKSEERLKRSHPPAPQPVRWTLFGRLRLRRRPLLRPGFADAKLRDRRAPT